MACQSKDLSVLAYANWFTMWHYVTGDKAEEVKAEGYFNWAADMLRGNDQLVINAGDSNFVVFVKSCSNREVVLE